MICPNCGASGDEVYSSDHDTSAGKYKQGLCSHCGHGWVGDITWADPDQEVVTTPSVAPILNVYESTELDTNDD